MPGGPYHGVPEENGHWIVPFSTEVKTIGSEEGQVRFAVRLQAKQQSNMIYETIRSGCESDTKSSLQLSHY